jgi:acetyltransferase-like isoleucine patch superfamily enzyme
MGFFKSKILKLAYLFYRWGKEIDDLNRSDSRRRELDRKAILNEGSIVYDEAVITNGQNDRNKIIIGKNSRILSNLLVFGHGGEIQIGENTFCGPDTRIWSAKKIVIGDRVMISHNVNIHDNISHPLNSRKRHEDFLHIFSVGYQKVNDLREREIVIEDDVWIGFNCTIMKGITIGKGAIIGSNTIVKEDVPPFAVVVGNPARILKYSD